MHTITFNGREIFKLQKACSIGFCFNTGSAFRFFNKVIFQQCLLSPTKSTMIASKRRSARKAFSTYQSISRSRFVWNSLVAVKFQVCEMFVNKWEFLMNFFFLSGFLKGFDPLLNLVLDSTVEYLRDPGNFRKFNFFCVLRFKSFLSDFPDESYKFSDDTRNLGLVVCRGTSVVLICPQDGMESIANPFVQQDA